MTFDSPLVESRFVARSNRPAARCSVSRKGIILKDAIRVFP